MTIGVIVRSMRSKKGLTQPELAKRAGLAKSVIFKLESDDANPSLHTLIAVADGLGISLSTMVAKLSMSTRHATRVGPSREAKAADAAARNSGNEK